MNVTGNVTNVYSQKKVSKAGKPYTHNYIEVDTFDHAINVGFQQPYALGNPVSFDVEFKFGAYQPVKEGSAPSAGGGGGTPVKQAPSGRGSAPFPVPADHPENRIMRQNALSHAAAVVSARISIAESQGLTNDEIANDILEIANILVDWSTGRREEKEVMKLMAQDKVA